MTAPLRTIPRDHRVSGVTYGTHYKPPRARPKPRRRTPRAFRYLGGQDRAAFLDALDGYRARHLDQALTDETRRFLDGLDAFTRELVTRQLVRATALTDRAYLDRLTFQVVDGRLVLACWLPVRWPR